RLVSLEPAGDEAARDAVGPGVLLLPLAASRSAHGPFAEGSQRPGRERRDRRRGPGRDLLPRLVAGVRTQARAGGDGLGAGPRARAAPERTLVLLSRAHRGSVGPPAEQQGEGGPAHGVNPKSETRNPKQTRNPKLKFPKPRAFGFVQLTRGAH